MLLQGFQVTIVLKRNLQERNMVVPFPEDERRSKRFLQMFENIADPTWGFYIYGIYTRPQGDANGQTDEDYTARLRALINKLQAHVADYLRYDPDLVHEQEIVDALRLTPAAYLPSASLGEACAHFCRGFVDTDEVEQVGPRYSWCMVINNTSL
jgi:hypothetical protein